jgi:hypothetical protein
MTHGLTLVKPLREAVRVERLQDISEEDIYKEGYPVAHEIACPWEWLIGLWDSITPNHKWESNPWVFVYEFKEVE